MGMAAAAATLADQVEAAQAEAAAIDLPDIDPAGIAVLGMGGSGIAADVLHAIAGPHLLVPVLPVKGYELPPCVTHGWLVLAVSFSGETEEVIVTTQEALERDVAVVAVTTGGTLEALVGGAGAPVVAVDATIPKPRAALAALSTPGLVIVDRLGLVPEDAFDLASAAEQARLRSAQCQPAKSENDNPARLLAQEIGDGVPVYHGGGALGAAAAYRAKCDVNENAKRPAYSSVSPELCHNEVCAVDQSLVVQLSTGLEHPQVARRMDIVNQMAGRAIAVRAEGRGAYARFLDLVTLTQWSSLYMAEAAGVDPGPIEAIDRLRAALEPDTLTINCKGS